MVVKFMQGMGAHPGAVLKHVCSLYKRELLDHPKPDKVLVFRIQPQGGATSSKKIDGPTQDHLQCRKDGCITVPHHRAMDC